MASSSKFSPHCSRSIPVIIEYFYRNYIKPGFVEIAKWPALVTEVPAPQENRPPCTWATGGTMVLRISKEEGGEREEGRTASAT
jgi:hypothetical protein